MALPVHNLTCEMAIARLYLRQADISNFQTTAALDGGHIVLKPCQLTLNSAPVTASIDMNLGVPGYQYEITGECHQDSNRSAGRFLFVEVLQQGQRRSDYERSGQRSRYNRPQLAKEPCRSDYI